MKPSDDRKETLEMLKRIFKGKDGKKFDEFLRRLCLYDIELMNVDVNRTMYNLGRRSVYLQIKQILEEENNG